MSSANNDRQPAGDLVPVKFSRLTRRGVLLGLSLTQLVALAIGGATLIGAFYAGGGMLLAYTAPVWVLAAVLTWIPVAGRPIVEWLPVASWWLWRTTGGQLLYRRRIVVPRPVGTLALPGDRARLREYSDPDTGAGMIHDPHAATLTVVCEVTHPAFVLLDPSEQERRVTSWGRVLATVCRSGRIATLQILERTLPDSGTGLAEWWASHGTTDGSWAADTYAELIDRAGPAGERHATTLSLSLDMKTSARQIRTAGGGIRGAAAVLRQEMNTLVAALRSADLSPSGWLTPGQIAVMLRSAYDPAIAAAIQGAKLKPTSFLAKMLFRRLARNRPTLLVRGAISDILGPEEAGYMRGAAPGMQYAEVPGVGHAPMLTEPAARAALASFLAGVA